ncbi:MAG: aminoglycoside adenylyltransferase domain-containing protein [Pseudomonadota bacterium]
MDGIEQNDHVQRYLARIVELTRDVLKDSLVGLYLHGSAVQSNWIASTSDIDVIGLVTGPIADQQQADLAQVLSYEHCPVPAQGLEYILCAKQAAQFPTIDCRFEFALSTGADWGTDCEASGVASDTLVDFALCRQSGHALFGPEPEDVFEAIPVALLRQSLFEELRWHLNELERSDEPRLLANSVLNAARSVHAAETGVILSKSDGVNWWLRRYRRDDLVSGALAIRHGQDAAPLDRDRVVDFVNAVDNRIAAL